MASRRVWLAGLCVAASALGLAVALGARHARTRQAAPAWPAPEAVLRIEAPAFPVAFGVRRIAIDPGHGAPNNAGNVSCFCVDEQDYTMEAALALRDRLVRTGHFDVYLTREGQRRVEYKDRIAEAQSFGAQVFVSLHSDVRGHLLRWPTEIGETCPLSFSAPGFSVLFSDEGDRELGARRFLLARAVARHMTATGLLPFTGGEYQGLYEMDPTERGVFVDRHAMEQRIFVLRRAAMPSIIVETHNATDPLEAARWRETATLDAFGASIAAALIDVLR